MALIQLQNIQVSFGGPALLDNLSMTIEPNERICLIGRNGAGKSTLMKVLNGEIKADSGEIIVQSSAVIAQLEQEVPRDMTGSVYEVVASGLAETGELLSQFHALNEEDDIGSEDWMTRFEKVQHKLEACNGWHFQNTIDTVISRLELDPDSDFAKLSGGIKRRVLLARALVQEPDVLLLDEPTNHLDIEAIIWLEDFLLNFNGSLVFITHDRSFLRRLATRIIEIDRGQATSWPGDYDNFLRRKEETLHAEELENARFDKKLAQEEVWIRQGIKARRTRNEGRVRALEKMRGERGERREQQGNAKMQVDIGQRTGKRVVEVENISYTLPNGRVLIDDFSTLVQRGDKIGLIGPNGVGKTTLLKILLGELEPDKNSDSKMIQGTNLKVAYFDQLRSQLDENRSVKDNLDRGADKVTINGQEKHVISYLQDFLFTPDRANSPVNALSGGERNRLLLAKLFTKPANVLVLDEPTNDLDVETLDLLEELLLNYEGTVLIVSHDRTFVNNLVTSCFVFEGDGKITDFLGGYDDWLRQKPALTKPTAAKNTKVNSSTKKAESVPTDTNPSDTKKLSFNEQHELKSLPKEIETLESKVSDLETQMADPNFYKQEHKVTAAITDELQEINANLKVKYDRWEALES
jgi:ATP-binding cassette subfamily F protein uup